MSDPTDCATCENTGFEWESGIACPDCASPQPDPTTSAIEDACRVLGAAFPDVDLGDVSDVLAALPADVLRQLADAADDDDSPQPDTDPAPCVDHEDCLLPQDHEPDPDPYDSPQPGTAPEGPWTVHPRRPNMVCLVPDPEDAHTAEVVCHGDVDPGRVAAALNGAPATPAGGNPQAPLSTRRRVDFTDDDPTLLRPDADTLRKARDLAATYKAQMRSHDYDDAQFVTIASLLDLLTQDEHKETIR